MIAYTHGVYDILRAKDLQEIDRQIQLSRQDGSEYFGLGIYDSNLCEHLGLNSPLKSLQDRLDIMRQVRGVDFVFPISTLHEDVLKDVIKHAFVDFIRNKEISPKNTEKQYEFGYAPGTYDLFHAGHLENLSIASSQCDKLIVGVKSDELVQEHKHRKPVISAEERMEILRHFKFVYGVHKYHSRDLHIANNLLMQKYNHSIDAIFLGSDLQHDFSDTDDLNIIYTPRDKETMKTKSTTAYRTLHLSRTPKSGYIAAPPINQQLNLQIIDGLEIDNL